MKNKSRKMILEIFHANTEKRECKIVSDLSMIKT